MRARLIVCVAVSLALAGAACASNPNGPQSGLRVAGESVVDLTTGESRLLSVIDGGASRDPAGYSWTSSHPQIVAVANGRLQAGAAPGQAVVTLLSPDGRMATVRVWVELPEHVPSTYRITVIYDEGIPESWKPAFQWAANRWQRVIRASLPAVDLGTLAYRPCPPLPLDARTGLETGTRIVIRRGPPGSGASGSPCARRPGESATTAVGVMEIAASASGIDAERLSGSLPLHEFGHVLGLVGVFEPGGSPSWFDYQRQVYGGPLGLEGYRREFGSSVSSIDARTGHWPFPKDVMHSFAAEAYITKASIGALMDLGYPAAWYGSGY